MDNNWIAKVDLTGNAKELKRLRLIEQIAREMLQTKERYGSTVSRLWEDLKEALEGKP